MRVVRAPRGAGLSMVVRQEQQAAASTRRYPRAWMTAGIALGLFALSIAVRWWGLAGQTHQMWGDEAQFMIFARNFTAGVYTTPFMADPRGLPALYDLALSVPLRLFGQTDVTVAREFSGVLGALSVPLLYLTALELGYPQRVGIVAATALATTFWDVSFSRLVLPNIMGVCATSAVVLLLVMAVRRASFFLAALAGIALAWACNAHLVGMMAVPLVTGWLILLVGGYSRWWKQGTPEHLITDAEGGRGLVSALSRWLGRAASRPAARLDLNSPYARPLLAGVLGVAVTLGVVALIAAWPLLQIYFSPGSQIQGHAASRYIFSADNRAAFAASHPGVGTGIVGILWYQLVYTAGLFTVRGQPGGVGGIFNLPDQPLLDAISGPLFILGVVTALWMWRRPAATLILLWLVVPLLLGTTLTIDPVWSFHRSVTAAPAMCLLIALGLETVLLALWKTLLRAFNPAWASRGLSALWPHLRLVAALVVAALIAVQGIGHYWNFADAQVTHQAFDNETHEWSLFLQPRGAVAVTVLGPAGWAVEFPTLYAPQATICPGRWMDTWARCPPPQFVIFDDDPGDAQQYAHLAHMRVHLDLSPDKITDFWYAEGQNLPDPAQLLGKV